MDVKQLDDPALMQLMAQGDESALGELYDRYARTIYSTALHVIGDTHLAEEITLDIFSRAWEKAGTYQEEKAKVITWLSRMTRNRAIDILRREDVRPNRQSLSWAEISVDPQAEENPEAAAGLSLDQQRVRQAMANLPDEQREALAYAYFKGYSHSEIAQALDLPLGTVKARIRSGMQKLRLELQDLA